MSTLPTFTIRELLEAGVHFGHKTERWNPKMQEFIYGERNGLHIIDLQKTLPMLYQALAKVKEVAEKNGKILFVGTKHQAQESIKDAASRCGQFYVNFRWLGGMLTNWNTVSQSIKTLKTLEEIAANDNEAEPTHGLTKKELLDKARKKDKLELSIGGVKDLVGKPDIVIIIDVRREELAVKEAQKLGIPVVGIVDTNSTPEGIDYPVPGNDDSIRAIKMYCKLFSDAALAGIQSSLTDAPVKPADEEVKTEESKAVEVKKEDKPTTKKDTSEVTVEVKKKKKIVKEDIKSEKAETETEEKAS